MEVFRRYRVDCTILSCQWSECVNNIARAGSFEFISSASFMLRLSIVDEAGHCHPWVECRSPHGLSASDGAAMLPAVVLKPSIHFVRSKVVRDAEVTTDSYFCRYT